MGENAKKEFIAINAHVFQNQVKSDHLKFTLCRMSALHGGLLIYSCFFKTSKLFRNLQESQSF